MIIIVTGSEAVSELRKIQEEIEAEHKAFIERMKALIYEEYVDDSGEPLTDDDDEAPMVPYAVCHLSEPRHLIPWYTSGFE